MIFRLSIFIALFCSSLSYAFDPFFSGELLYWQATEGGLNLAISNAVALPTIPTTLRIQNGKILDINSLNNFGFRIQIGSDLPRDCWDLRTIWTHFNGDQKKSFQAAPGTFFSAINDILTSSVSQIDQIQGKWNLNLNIIDLLLSGRFSISERVFIIPYLGLKGGFIHQNFNVDYHFLPASITITPNANTKNQFNFRGIGPTGGFETEWRFNQNWSLFGSSATAILYGSYHTKSQHAGGSTLVFNFKRDDLISHFTYQFVLGLQWSVSFGKNYSFTTRLAGEQNILPGMNKMIHSTNSPTSMFYEERNDDLELLGLNFSMRFDF